METQSHSMQDSELSVSTDVSPAEMPTMCLYVAGHLPKYPGINDGSWHCQ